MKKGDKVRYYPHSGALPEKGIIKSMCDNPEYAFVVYKCGGEWSRYEEFTGCRTDVNDLKLGWEADKPNLSDANGRQYDKNVDEDAAWRAYYEEQAYLKRLI